MMSLPSLTLPAIASPANLLTFGRIVGSPVLFWLVLEAEPDRGTSWAAFALGLVFALSDFFDGKLARASGTVSRSGAFLDPLADKIVVLGVAVCLVSVERIHWLPVAIIAVREVWISLFRVNWARQGLSVPARRAAKWKTVVQGLALEIAVLPPLEHEEWVIDGLIWVAVAFTVVTGWQYLRDGSAATSVSGA